MKGDPCLCRDQLAVKIAPILPETPANTPSKVI